MMLRLKTRVAFVLILVRRGVVTFPIGSMDTPRQAKRCLAEKTLPRRSIQIRRSRSESEIGHFPLFATHSNEYAKSLRHSKRLRRTIASHLLVLLLLIPAILSHQKAFAEEKFVNESNDVSPFQKVPIHTYIEPCQRSNDPMDPPENCVSTASVRQLDLYMPPWTFNGMSKDEVIARIKGVIESDKNLVLMIDKSNYLQVQVRRNFSIDEIELVVNEQDQVITYRSRQISGPAISDLNANRNRLEDIRLKARLGVMGDEYGLQNPNSEGGLGQLKAFYGFQSGKGFEDINLDD